MEVLARALFHGDKEDQIAAANGLSKLKRSERNLLVIDAGIIDPLVSMLCSNDYRPVEAALFALISLARSSESNKIKITKAGAVPVLIGLLIEENGSLVELAAMALLMLSSCTANRLVIAATGVIPVLVELLSRDDSNVYDGLQVRLDAIDTLHNLSTCHEAVASIVAEDAVFSILQMIHNSDKSSKVVEKAIALLETVVSSSETGLAQIGDAEGGILALVETIEEASQQSREHAVEVLFHICKSCRTKYREMILKEGAIPGLLELCVDGTWKAKETAQALLMLLRESPKKGPKMRQLRNPFFEQIMRGIDSDEEKVAETTMRFVEKMITSS